jgi:flagellar protein FliS
MQSYHYKQLQAYQQARMHVGKAQQVVLLYDGIIRFLQQAQNAQQDGDIVERCTILNKAITIVVGLQSCLDMENYPEISATLYDYYDMLYIRMQAFQQGASAEEYSILIDEVKQMRDAWAATDEQQNTASSASEQEEISALMSAPLPLQMQPSDSYMFSA